MMIEDMMPTPCESCAEIIDFINLVSDPLDEYEMVCRRCAYARRREAEERLAYDYEHRMPEYQKHIR